MATYPPGWVTEALVASGQQAPAGSPAMTYDNPSNAPAYNWQQAAQIAAVGGAPQVPQQAPQFYSPPVVNPARYGSTQRPYQLPAHDPRQIAGYNPLANGYAAWLNDWKQQQPVQQGTPSAPVQAPVYSGDIQGGGESVGTGGGGPSGSGAGFGASPGSVGTGLGGFSIGTDGAVTANTTGMSNTGVTALGNAVAPGIGVGLAMANNAVNNNANAAAAAQTAAMADSMGANAMGGMAATAGVGGTGGAAAAASASAAASAAAAGMSDAAQGAAGQAAANAAIGGMDAAGAAEAGMDAAIGAQAEGLSEGSGEGGGSGEGESGGGPGGDSGGDGMGGGDAGAGYALGGFVTQNRLRGPDPKGPDQGYGALRAGEYIIPSAIVKALGREYFDKLTHKKR